MKNRLIGIVILVLCFCVFLTACDTRKPGKKADESTAPIESSAPTINETENNNQVSNPTTIPAPSQGSDSSEGEVPCLDANSYEEYLKIIKTVQLPEGFVKYSDISQLGDFEYFVFLSHVIIGNNSKYEYDLIDENNITFSFSVEPVEDNQDASPLPLIDDVNTQWICENYPPTPRGGTFTTASSINILTVSFIISLGRIMDGFSRLAAIRLVIIPWEPTPLQKNC